MAGGGEGAGYPCRIADFLPIEGEEAHRVPGDAAHDALKDEEIEGWNLEDLPRRSHVVQGGLCFGRVDLRNQLHNQNLSTTFGGKV